MRRSLQSLLIILFIGSCATPTRVPTITPKPSHTSTRTPVPTSTPTDTPIPTSTPTSVPTVTSIPIHPVGKVVLHGSTEEMIYSWYSYVPNNLSREKTIYILITGIYGGTYDYEESARTAKLMLQERLQWPYFDQFVLLVPVIPRKENPHSYPVAFGLNSFRERDTFFSRADLKVNLMIDELIDDLINDGYQMSPKVMIEGFSSGSMFAQRYALLHPDRVKAIAAGQCGGNFTLPEYEYEGNILNWPVGINNLGELAGIQFDQESYTEIAQFIYIGDLDTGEGDTTIVWNRLHPTWGAQYMWESVSQMEFLHNTFGETDPVRLQAEIDYLNKIGYENIEFKLYPGARHEITDQMIDDFMEFLSDVAMQ